MLTFGKISIQFLWPFKIAYCVLIPYICMICKYFLHLCRLPFYFWLFLQTSLVAQMVKRLPTMQKTRVRSWGQEEPLEKEMAPHSSTLVWKIPWTEEPGRLQSMGSQSDTTEWLDFTMFKWLLKELSSSSHIHTYTDTRWMLAVWRRCVHLAD